ncbi:MAG TPA: hypothetical protein VJ748_01960 [Vitreimonas sp.]|nr:hypothetical protein [Vitreimonas sp.]
MSRKRWIWLMVLVVIVAAVAGGAWASRDQVTYAHIATGYAAKQVCSCLHVSGRTLDSCISDYPEDVRRNITVTSEADNVRASVLFGAIGSEATFDGEYGCRIVE